MDVRHASAARPVRSVRRALATRPISRSSSCWISGTITLHDRTLVRRLVLDSDRPTVVAAEGVHRDRPDELAEYVADQFVIASGYCWSSHLLLLSANSRYPDGLANTSGLLGRYMTGHAYVTAQVDMDLRLYPGLMSHSLVSRQFFRCPTDGPYVRHDLRIWDSTYGDGPGCVKSVVRSCWGTGCSPTGARARVVEPPGCGHTTTSTRRQTVA